MGPRRAWHNQRRQPCLDPHCTTQFSGSRSYYDRKRLTKQDCIDDFVEPSAGAPVTRTRMCARAYRDFEGLYDVSITAFTQDKGLEGLVSQLSMRGVSWENATALAKRFFAELQWTK